MVPPRIPSLVVLALLCLFMAWAVRHFFRTREVEEALPAVPAEHLTSYVLPRPTGLPATYPPVYAGDVPLLCTERNRRVTAQTYIDLISFALCTPNTCCLPIDPAFLPAILIWYEDKRKDFAIHLRVLHPGSEGRMARVIVSSLETPTDKLPAIHS